MTLGSRLAGLFSPSQPAYLNAAGSATQDTSLRDGSESESRIYSKRREKESTDMDEEEEAAHRAPYTHCMIAGGIGGTTGDMLMHSLDTVKTRQQGDPRIPPKYTTLSSSYLTILRQEGIGRGLYSGVFPAFLGSFPGTLIFFGTYEWSKRNLLDRGCNPTIAYLTGGFLADLAASVVYVPSEVLKTRLQLQGRYNNPFFKSGYNYRSTLDAFRTIVRTEGAKALFYGYKATIFRDLPFSALQFAFYEQEQHFARSWVGGRDIGISLEILTAASAGGLAGVLTCPLDVVKTRIQTQVNEDPAKVSSSAGATAKASQNAAQALKGAGPRRLISTTSPSVASVPQSAPKFDTSSVLMGLRLLYRTEGLAGWFRGVGPRGVWTSVQSGTMLVCYQLLLRKLKIWDGGSDDGLVVD